MAAPAPAPPPTPTPLPDDHTVPHADEHTVEVDDQQGLDNTCGARVVVESLALAGVITPEQQPALAIQLWDFEHPGIDRFTKGYGTTIAQDMVLFQHACDQLGATLDLQPLGMDMGAFLAALDADDQGGFVHMIDSCKSVDWSNDTFTPQALMAAAGAFSPQCGWIATINGHKSVAIAVDLGMLMPWLGLRPGVDYHWMLTR